MLNDYESFLEYRAARRQLAATFASPRLLLLHVIAFIVVMTATWVYGSGWGLWSYRDNFIAPVLVGLVWSLVLAGHALLHYRRSAANRDQREQAVEDAMRRLIATRAETPDNATLFDMHRSLEAPLQAQSRWSASLGAFALVNALSWVAGALNMGSSWPFQMTPIFAAVVIGGVQAYLFWQQQRGSGRKSWVSRFPLMHLFVYLAATVILALLGAMRAVNPWDVNTLVEWGLVLLLASILWNVILQPLIERMGSLNPAQGKRKPAYAVALSDDGELVVDGEDGPSLYSDDEPPQQMRSRR
jgi:hypothetical protein